MLEDIKTPEFNNTACIVYPAEYPSHRVQPKKDNLHSTALFLGDIDEDLGGITKEELVSLLSPVDTNIVQYANTVGWDLFGQDKNIPVVKLALTSFLSSLRQDFEDVLMSVGIESASEFEYSPHVTVDLATYLTNNLPRWVMLKPAVLWYRDDWETIGTARRGE